MYLVVIMIFKWGIVPLGSQHMGSTSVPPKLKVITVDKKNIEQYKG